MGWVGGMGGVVEWDGSGVWRITCRYGTGALFLATVKTVTSTAIGTRLCADKER